MIYDPPLIEANFVKRYKRFFADCVLADGSEVTAHCPNPGSMKTCQAPGGRVWLTGNNDPKRKLKYTWELAEVDGALINVNTGRTNRIVEEALHAGVVEELDNFSRLRREVKYGESSRIDFLLEYEKFPNTYVEVKNVTLDVGGGISAFPDSVTKRGAKHLRELMAVVDEGLRGVMLFCCSRSDVERVRPAADIDPEYAQTLREALAHGVTVLAYRCEISPQSITLSRRIPFDID